MTYQEFIQNIIDTRGQWSEEVYSSLRGCEKHHIVPACLGGEGDFIEYNYKSKFYKHSHHINCIYLYPAEHFEAHKLLADENSDNESLCSAFWAMCNKNSNCTEQYIYTPEQYEKAKQDFIRTHSLNEKLRCLNKTEEQKLVENTKRKETWANKSSENITISIEKRNKTCEDRYGDKNYCNQKQRVQTLLNKSDEEKQASIKKRKNTIANKSAEEKELTHQRQSESAKKVRENMSEEQKASWYQKLSEFQLGGKNHNAIAVKCITTNIVYGCKKDAMQSNNITLGQLNKCIKNGIADKNGYYWERI